MPWQPTLASAHLDEETEEDLTARNARDVNQARLTWQTRKGRSLELRVRWDRFYRTHTFWPGQLQVIQAQLETRIAELRAVTDKPEPWTTGSTWTQAMEMLEDREAELSALQNAIRSRPDGG